MGKMVMYTTEKELNSFKKLINGIGFEIKDVKKLSKLGKWMNFDKTPTENAFKIIFKITRREYRKTMMRMKLEMQL